MLRKLIAILCINICLISSLHADDSHAIGSPALIQYQLALSFLLGRNGLQKSPKKAAALFKILAEQNWSAAQHMLGNMYYKGKGVEKNDLLAYKWLSIASRDNLKLAEAVSEKRKQLQVKLSGSRLQQAEQWIESWQPDNSSNLTISRNNY